MSDSLELRVLGPFRVIRDGVPVALPTSRKTLALLAYLAITGRAHSRDHLVELLWDVPDDPRGALRWTLSRARGVVGSERIVTQGDTVRLDLDGLFVDALALERAASAGFDLDDDALQALAPCSEGLALEDLSQPDFFRYESWRVAMQASLQRRQVALLDTLIARSDPELALPWARSRLGLTPDEPEAHATLVRLLRETGRETESAGQAEISKQHLAPQGHEALRILRRATRPAAPAKATPASVEQEIRLCRSRDGVPIAWASTGTGPVLVKTANWLSHLEYDWKSPLWRHLAKSLAADFRLIRYDQRGTGLSGREVDDFSLEAQLADLEAVVEASGIERFSLLGISQGCRVAIAYAARHPERVDQLVLYGGSPRGFRSRPRSGQRRAGLQGLILDGWAQDNPAFRQVFTTLFMPHATAEQARWFNELQRVSTSPENAYAITEANAVSDVSDQLDRVTAPTLVAHATRDAMVAFDEGRLLAAGLPKARFLPLDSDNHLLLEDEPAMARFLEVVREFLGVA